MFDRGSWNTLLSHPVSGAGCEISGEGGTSPGQNFGCGISEEDGTSQGWPSACAWCRDPSPWWHGARIAIRSNSIRIPQEDTWRAPLSGLPKKKHTTLALITHPDDSISYPDMLSGSLTKVHKPCYVIPTACHSPCSASLRWCVRMPILLAFRICLWKRTLKLRFFMFLSFPFALPWIPKNSPQSWIALVIKLLIKTPKLTQFD